MSHKVAIIGAGAAGCFCAINLKRICPDAEIVIFEAGRKPLAKVAVTGGGRCNLTNTFRQVSDLKAVYPRGNKLMKRALQRFSHEDTWNWFEGNDIPLVAQEDECVFPQSQDAMQIVHTLLHEIRSLGIQLLTQHKIQDINPDKEGGFRLQFCDNRQAISGKANGSAPDTTTCYADYVVVCTGGHPSPKGFEMFSSLHLDIQAPCPSLFTLNIEGEWHQELMGIVVERASTLIAGTKFRSHGALLLTHWGMSGPAILKLTSYAARHLAENKYRGTLLVNWCGEQGEEEVRQNIKSYMRDYASRLVSNVYPTHLCARHWHYLLSKSNISETQRWGALNSKEQNRLTSTLTADAYSITGKCPFKEEFVTCGGVSLSNININTLEAKKYPGLFLAGEVLDVDAVTGGFNLQAAWSMGFIASQEIAKRLSCPL